MFDDYIIGPRPERTEERFVYLVPSDKNPKRKYRVDMTANNGGGECACMDFAARRQPAIKAGKPLFSMATTCRHSRRVFAYFFMELMRDLAYKETHEN